jgi:hypothetical protein
MELERVANLKDLQTGDRLVVNGTLYCDNRRELPYLASGLKCTVTDVCVYPTLPDESVIFLDAGYNDLNRLALFISLNSADIQPFVGKVM